MGIKDEIDETAGGSKTRLMPFTSEVLIHSQTYIYNYQAGSSERVAYQTSRIVRAGIRRDPKAVNAKKNKEGE